MARIQYRVNEESESWRETSRSFSNTAPPRPGPQQFEVPNQSSRGRISPALDPHHRHLVSNLGKWMLMFAILLFAAYVPISLKYAPPTVRQHQLAAVTASAIFGAMIAVGVPRTILPNIFGAMREPVEAFRDWVLVGLVTGLLYFASIAAFIKLDPHTQLANASPSSGAMFDNVWLQYRLPVLIVAGIVGLFIARMIAIRSESIVATSPLSAFLQILVQAAILSLIARSFEKAFDRFSAMPQASVLVLAGAILCSLIAFGILAWSLNADMQLNKLYQYGKGSETGIVTSDGPVPMRFSVIGGRSCGKTVLLTAAYYEWSMQDIGKLRIVPAPQRDGGMGIGTDLQQVAADLYTNNAWPVGTVVCQSLPFDLKLEKDAIAHFEFLDFPGGAMSGRAAKQIIVNQFWEQVDSSDGLILVADMSYVRMGKRDADFVEVFDAYRRAMQRVVDRNGRNRVVPVALVLTKCDEYVDLDTGELDVAGIWEGISDFGYKELEQYWRKLSADQGPGFAEFTIWMTSAVQFSEPDVDAEGQEDFSKPYRLVPPPPQINPVGCASPILWMCAKAMYWNVTAFRDLQSFLLGSSPLVRRRIEAISELERIAQLRATGP